MSSIKNQTIQATGLKAIWRSMAFVFMLLLCLSATNLVQAQQQTMNLDSVLLRIRNSNPMLQEYNYRARAMDAYAEGARSWMPPMVGAGLYMLPYPGQEVMEGRDKGMLMFTAEQAIPNPAKQRAKEEYMRSRAALETAASDVTFNQLRTQAKEAYYNRVVLERKMNVLQESERIVTYMLKLARVRYPYSKGSLGSIYKAEARLHGVENMQLMTASQIAQQTILLNTLMNQPKEFTFSIDTTVTVPDLSQLASDTAYLAAARSDVRQLDRTIASMQLNLQLEQLERKPDFSIRFDHMYPRDNMMPQQFTAMGMVSIPIAPWSSKMYKANSRAMQLEIEGMKKQREAILNEAQGMVRTMALELKTVQEQTENYSTKILPALKKNYDVTMLAYEQNTAQLPEVIDAWEALNMARIEYLDKLQDLYLMVVNYEREIEK